MGQFDEIRPYNDDEVKPVLAELLADEELITAVASLRFGVWSKWLKPVIYPLVKTVLKKQLKQVNSIKELQSLVKRYMDGMVAKTTTSCTVSGLEKLDPNQAYLFISNHRDIALDPAFVNYAFYHNGFEMVRIAIGDNLLTKPYVSHLMRLNKSFIVNRSAKGRAMLAAYKQLSQYIRFSLQEEIHSVWIAQREGRAKDGNDKTEPAMIKMVGMSQNKKQESFAELVCKLCRWRFPMSWTPAMLLKLKSFTKRPSTAATKNMKMKMCKVSLRAYPVIKLMYICLLVIRCRAILKMPMQLLKQLMSRSSITMYCTPPISLPIKCYTANTPRVFIPIRR